MAIEELTDLTIDRFAENPLITPQLDDRIGSNINGPSLIRVPDWIEAPLGRYYLYFAHHNGTFIRLAYADELTGPWQVYSPGTLDLSETRFDRHIASPDVHVDHEDETIRLYYHGCCGEFAHPAGPFSQATDVAISSDGIDFTVTGTTLGNSYFRVWEHEGRWYAIANDGHLYRGTDPEAPFDRLHEVFPRNRHVALQRLGPETLRVFLTRRGDRPERIQVAVIDLSRPANEWVANPHPPETVLWPTRDYEGGDLQLETSETGPVYENTRALRDPAVYQEAGRTYVFYAAAGERAIAGGVLDE